MLDRAGVTGYAIFNKLSGKDSHGFHEGHLTFNEDDALIMFVVAIPEDPVKPILEGLAPFYSEHTGVVFITDIEVTRPVKFRK